MSNIPYDYVNKKMTVDYFGDDLGLTIYTFQNATIIDALQYLRETQFFTTKYFITNIIVKRKFLFFGKSTIKVFAQTEKAIQMYGIETGEPMYQILMT